MNIELTQEELDTVINALCTEESEANANAEAWKGRSRESRYLKEAKQASDLLAKINRNECISGPPLADEEDRLP